MDALLVFTSERLRESVELIVRLASQMIAEPSVRKVDMNNLKTRWQLQETGMMI